jgi:hypothetical protein
MRSTVIKETKEGKSEGWKSTDREEMKEVEKRRS